ncbi:hypothetical protein EZS27_021739 [termite gut metagenome]|uniref:Bacteriophage abortive infection AbiH n=1 Tax=termite gut metagenome TaxID=433724 RepID=A0A5J4R9Q5_9ZZZZ
MSIAKKIKKPHQLLLLIRMNNLVIIGNGFDLAHGLKTSYTNFIDDLIKCAFTEQYSPAKKLEGILVIPDRHIVNRDDLFDAIKNYDGFTPIIRCLLDKRHSQYWCDIEREYFDLLLSIDSKKSIKNYADVKKLNLDFQRIKQELDNYLSSQEIRNCLKGYKILLSYLCDNKSLVLNFNYTDTIERLYTNEVKSNRLVHIHGELKSDSNPMIFGFSANDSESLNLVDKENNEYLRHIKRHEYKMTDNEARLKEFLNQHRYIEVSILGHSCGLSDKHILGLIFNHKNVSSIRVYYYEDKESYFNLRTNIFRIMRDYNTYGDRLIDFRNSTRMPQWDDSDEQHTEMKEFILKLKRQDKENEEMENLNYIGSLLH